MVALLRPAALQAQNPIPNSPPSMQPHNPALQPASAAAPAKAPADTAPAAGAPAQPQTMAAVGGDYVLAPSDTLEMSVFNEPTLTTQTRVSADGTAQFPLIGEVKLGGVALREARENDPPALQRRLPRRAAGVPQRDRLPATSFHGAQGQVNKPGTFDFPGGESLDLSAAIGIAGGPTRLASDTVQIKRHSGGRRSELSKSTPGSSTPSGVKPFELLPNDVITVPESWL